MLSVRLFMTLLLVLIGSVVVPLARPAGQRLPPLVIRSTAGQDLFAFYCASCHGRDGRGGGPVAGALKVPPPDLTRLAQRHGGTFPRQRVEVFVTDDGSILTPAHGSSDMPVWGPIFHGLDPSDTLVRVRIANLVSHIESMQVR
jgi:mono/diheme cytochrome c family protein